MLRLIRCSLINPIFILSFLILPGFGLSIVFAKLPPSALVDAEGNRYINIGQTQSEISIDGLLSDEEWKNANFQKYFLQREPAYGEETSEETQVALLRDEENLYLAVKCYDYLTNQQNRQLENDMKADFRIDFQNSSIIGLGINYKSEFIDELWEVRENLFIPVGTYRGLGFRPFG